MMSFNAFKERFFDLTKEFDDYVIKGYYDISDDYDRMADLYKIFGDDFETASEWYEKLPSKIPVEQIRFFKAFENINPKDMRRIIDSGFLVSNKEDLDYLEMLDRLLGSSEYKYVRDYLNYFYDLLEISDFDEDKLIAVIKLIRESSLPIAVVLRNFDYLSNKDLDSFIDLIRRDDRFIEFMTKELDWSVLEKYYAGDELAQKIYFIIDFHKYFGGNIQMYEKVLNMMNYYTLYGIYDWLMTFKPNDISDLDDMFEWMYYWYDYDETGIYAYFYYTDDYEPDEAIEEYKSKLYG